MNLYLVIQCSIVWPDSDRCIEIHFSIPIIEENATNYQLNATNLEKIWNSLTNNDFETHGIHLEKYTKPDNGYWLMMWLIVTFVIVGLFFGFLFYMRYVGIYFENIKK